MSAACCEDIERCLHAGTAKPHTDTVDLGIKQGAPASPRLYNRVTVMLLVLWMGIVTVALETSSIASAPAAATMEVFLRSLF